MFIVSYYMLHCNMPTCCPGVHRYSVMTICQDINILTIFIFGNGSPQMLPITQVLPDKSVAVKIDSSCQVEYPHCDEVTYEMFSL